ncbi:hypothetical protein LCGC14_1509330 [marine sediment metagenome]|uniref:Uncharacterized protein n=1 Tax=marine sediment metagenome TaxID=412755 RepID=A0A0F9M309_9ZZZZ
MSSPEATDVEFARPCVANGQPWHKTCWWRGTPQHLPKRSQMKNPPIVAYPCWPLHDALDNGLRLDGRRVMNRISHWDGDSGPKGYYLIEDRETKEVLLKLEVKREP